MSDLQPTGSFSREIAAPPATVWAMVADVTRMGEWSPETVSCEWIKGATEPTVGAKFQGSNTFENHSWKTTCTVVESQAGEVFAFESKIGPLSIARWEYRFAPTETGCTVTESWTDQRSWLIEKMGAIASGVKDRATSNEAGIRESLDRLAAAAEG